MEGKNSASRSTITFGRREVSEKSASRPRFKSRTLSRSCCPTFREKAEEKSQRGLEVFESVEDRLDVEDWGVVDGFDGTDAEAVGGKRSNGYAVKA